MIFFFFISFLILQRVAELLLSKQNEKWLLKNNAVEYGKGHYPLIVILHVLFIISLLSEYSLQEIHPVNFLILVLYFLLLALKTWTILSLGKFWNTKIYHITGMPLIKKGPFRLFRHPNYIIVIFEIALIPIAFHLYKTAIIFSLLNLVVLYVRINEENKVMKL